MKIQQTAEARRRLRSFGIPNDVSSTHLMETRRIKDDDRVSVRAF